MAMTVRKSEPFEYGLALWLDDIIKPLKESINNIEPLVNNLQTCLEKSIEYEENIDSLEFGLGILLDDIIKPLKGSIDTIEPALSNLQTSLACRMEEQEKFINNLQSVWEKHAKRLVAHSAEVNDQFLRLETVSVNHEKRLVAHTAEVSVMHEQFVKLEQRTAKLEQENVSYARLLSDLIVKKLDEHEELSRKINSCSCTEVMEKQQSVKIKMERKDSNYHELSTGKYVTRAESINIRQDISLASIMTSKGISDDYEKMLDADVPQRDSIECCFCPTRVTGIESLQNESPGSTIYIKDKDQPSSKRIETVQNDSPGSMMSIKGLCCDEQTSNLQTSDKEAPRLASHGNIIGRSDEQNTNNISFRIQKSIATLQKRSSGSIVDTNKLDNDEEMSNVTHRTKSNETTSPPESCTDEGKFIGKGLSSRLDHVWKGIETSQSNSPVEMDKGKLTDAEESLIETVNRNQKQIGIIQDDSIENIMKDENKAVSHDQNTSKLTLRVEGIDILQVDTPENILAKIKEEVRGVGLDMRDYEFHQCYRFGRVSYVDGRQQQPVLLKMLFWRSQNLLYQNRKRFSFELFSD